MPVAPSAQVTALGIFLSADQRIADIDHTAGAGITIAPGDRSDILGQAVVPARAVHDIVAIGEHGDLRRPSADAVRVAAADQ
jgi:hypothetical protein